MSIYERKYDIWELTPEGLVPLDTEMTFDSILTNKIWEYEDKNVILSYYSSTRKKRVYYSPFEQTISTRILNKTKTGGMKGTGGFLINAMFVKRDIETGYYNSPLTENIEVNEEVKAEELFKYLDPGWSDYGRKIKGLTEAAALIINYRDKCRVSPSSWSGYTSSPTYSFVYSQLKYLGDKNKKSYYKKARLKLINSQIYITYATVGLGTKNVKYPFTYQPNMHTAI